MSDTSFIQLFYVALEAYLQQAETEVRNGNLSAARKIAHKMLGLCQLFGTPEQTALCEQAEHSKSLPNLKIILNDLRKMLSDNKADRQ
ncbi:TPA: Hpt domain-containing protein [Enterobacter hormaechei]|nr:Hpt domain-containing protein [Enterobacter hormaechei]HDT2963716.1 Hpt domain-containing protein [Enterobacter hormaechei subsp. steigerwaltii]